MFRDMTELHKKSLMGIITAACEMGEVERSYFLGYAEAMAAMAGDKAPKKDPEPKKKKQKPA